MRDTEAAELALSVAGRSRPGEEIEAYVVVRRDVDVDVHNDEVESLSTAEIAGIGVRVIENERLGFAYGGSLDADVAGEVLADARDNVAFGSVDPALSLPEPDEAGTVPDLELVAEGFGATGIDAKVDLAVNLSRSLRARDPRIRAVEAGYGDAHVLSVVANSHGLLRTQERTITSTSAYAIVEDEGQTQTGFGYDLARDPAELDVESVAVEAAERSLGLLGASRPESARVPVVLDQFVAAQIAGVIAGTLGGEAVLKGRSIFGDRLGDMIASPAVTFFDDPTDPEAFGAAPFDSEGVATRRNEYLQEGVLGCFAQNTWTGRRTGTATTGNAVRASYRSTPGVGMRSIGFRPDGGLSLAELLGAADGGIYVQSVQGLHSGVNAVSGDFSVGAEGFRISGGRLAEPFREATIASTIQRMLLDFVAVGSEARMLSGGPAVHVLIGEMTLGGR